MIKEKLKKAWKYIVGVLAIIGGVIGGIFLINLKKNKEALLEKTIKKRKKDNEKLIKKTDDWLDDNPPLDKLD